MFKFLIGAIVAVIALNRAYVSRVAKNVVTVGRLMGNVEMNYVNTQHVGAVTANEYPPNLRMVEIHESEIPSDDNPYVVADFWFSLYTLWNESRPASADAITGERDAMNAVYTLIKSWREMNLTPLTTMETDTVDRYHVLLSGANYDLDYDLVGMYGNNTFAVTLMHHTQNFYDLRLKRVYPVGEFYV